MKLKLEVFAPADLRSIEVRAVHRTTWLQVLPNANKIPQPARTVFAENGEVLAVFGMVTDNKVWAFFSPRAAKFSLRLVRLLRRLLKTQGCEIRATIRPQDAKAVRLATALGFRHEQGNTWCAGSTTPQI